MAGQLAKIIAELAPEHPDVLTTGFVSYETGTHKAGDQTDGKLDPDAPELDGLTGEALAKAMVARYGDGFGFPYALDTTVGSAQSKLPDEHARNRGWVHEHDLPDPSPATLAKLGFSGAMTETDTMDCSACYKFQELVAEMNDEAGADTPASGNKIGTTKPAAVAQPPVDTTKTTLCGGRFEVSVKYQTRDHERAVLGNGTAYPQLVPGDHTAMFWLFEESGMDVAVKMLGPDGDGWWWVVVGSLTAESFTVTVTDLDGGAEARPWSYSNAPKTFASHADYRAFRN